MPAQIRVFVSSTMDDLANEREAVVEAIRSLNLEPVNAEGISPNGGASWQVIDQEIRSSHICVLLLGERYGWIPTDGYGSGQGKSVTHLEVDLAREQGIPILPFCKTLKYGADNTSVDAKLRDLLRKEIGDWKNGHFREEFRLASDLRTKVTQALLDVFKESFLRKEVQAQDVRAQAATVVTTALLTDRPSMAGVNGAGSPEVLFAGAGLSLSAGYPSANALAGLLGQSLGLKSDLLASHSLAQLFEVAEMTFGRTKTVEIVAGALNPPLRAEPTPAHIAAVQRFCVILTTNYDQLFERACAMLDIQFLVRTPGDGAPSATTAPVTIFKIDGSIDRPDTLVLSPADLYRARLDQSFWMEVEAILARCRPIVIGHSMRDSNSLRLMDRRNRDIRGVYVAPVIDPIDGSLLLEQLNLEGILSSGSDYLWRRPVYGP